MERRARTQVVGRTLRLLLGVGFLIYAIPPSGAPALSILHTRCAGFRSVSQAFRQVSGARSRVPATWYLIPGTGLTPRTESGHRKTRTSGLLSVLTAVVLLILYLP
jgi:tetrahydromethanopterin S-methyltransferase subunit F